MKEAAWDQALAPEPKKEKSPAKPRKKSEARSKWVVPFLDIRFNSVRLFALAGAAKSKNTGSQSPESGGEVSGVVENLSRKIQHPITKCWARVVECIYP
jgi:hypothetical protein